MPIPAVINKYPLDLTGRNPTNLVINEPHTLTANVDGASRAFVPNYGSFYTQGLVIRNGAGETLKPRVDFIATYLFEEASLRTGLEVCGAIVIVNPNVTDSIYIDYQCVGGDYSQSVDALDQVIAALNANEDDKPVKWGNIKGKPTTYPPGEHMHALWELYGFEYMVTELERIAAAIKVGDQAAFDEVREYAKSLHDDNLDRINAVDDRLTAHMGNSSNPHNVSKYQVGLGSVSNLSTASRAEHQEAGRVGGSPPRQYVTANYLNDAFNEMSNDTWFDYRYIQRDTAVDGALRVNGGQLEAYVSGSWHIVWPPQWQ